MAVNLAAIKDLLLPGLRGIVGKYEQIPSQYDKVFTRFDSKLALERTAEMRYLALAQLKTEGGQTAVRQPGGRALCVQPGAHGDWLGVRDHPQGDR